MKAKKKLIVSMLVVAFVLLSIIATVAIAFALTQQTIKTTLNITYQAEDLDGTASATFTVGGVTESLTAEKNGQVIGDKLVFKASDTESAGNLMFPEDGLALTSENDNVVIQYTYSNTGSKHYIASMDFDANIEKENMKVEYSINGTDYSEQRYAVVVPAKTSNKNYWIKISIIDKAENASFTGDFNWVLNGCDPQDKAYLSMPSLEFQGKDGAYSVSVNGEGEYLPEVVFPSSINGDQVTTIAQNTSLTAEQKAQVTSVYIPDSVTTIGASAFEGFTNLETVTLAQNQSVSGASAQSATGITTIGKNAFKNCSSLDGLIIPNTVTSCDKTAFTGCSGLHNLTLDTMNEDVLSAVENLSNLHVTIGNSVTTIVDEAFYCFGNLKEILIPASVTSIGANPFCWASELESIKVEEGNSIYHSAGNCLIETESKTLIVGCKTSVIPTDGSVTSIGDYAFYGCETLTSIEIPNTVIDIGDYAFFACHSLTEIVIPNSVTSIGEAAFAACEDSIKIVISNSVTTIGCNVFESCISLPEIEIPESVTSIGDSAFYGCWELTKIEIPNSVISIGDFAFGDCSGLTELVIPKSVTSCNEYAFDSCSNLQNLTLDTMNEEVLSAVKWIASSEYGGYVSNLHVTIGNNVTNIVDDAFSYCDGLTQITIPDSVISIGENAFLSCGITEIVIPSSVTSIGEAAFAACGITEIEIPNSVTSIGNWLFNGTNITEIVIPKSVTSIGDYVFAQCYDLTTIKVEEGNSVYHSAGNCIIETESKTLIAGCATSVIPTDGSVTSIGNFAFAYCETLTEIVIPDTITSIGDWAFEACCELAELVIPDSVTSIGDGAFVDCYGLTGIIFTNSKGWTVDGQPIPEDVLSDPETAAQYVSSYEEYCGVWTRS